MSENPKIIASHQFVCITTLLEDSNIIAKEGVQGEGVYCFALRKEKLSFALKVLSGSKHV